MPDLNHAMVSAFYCRATFPTYADRQQNRHQIIHLRKHRLYILQFPQELPLRVASSTSPSARRFLPQRELTGLSRPVDQRFGAVVPSHCRGKTTNRV